MLKRKKEIIQDLNARLLKASPEEQKGYLAQLMDGYSKLLIDDPVRPFSEENLNEIANNVDYGI
ncbi:hypothetical protein ACFOEQ_01775 [Chryseobacterium arachidis]